MVWSPMQNKIALVTGATSGIGLATAQALALIGTKLIICGRRAERLQAVAEELSTLTSVHTLNFDISDSTACFQAIDSLPAAWQQIDILVNNAGNAHGFGSIHEGDFQDWDAMIAANIQGLLYVSRAITPQMVKRQSGHIINVSSIAGKQTYANGTVYCASKKAVEAISEGMRLDLTQHGIKITNIAPGAVETEFSLVRFKGDSEKAAKVYQGFQPLTPENVAEVIVYAISAPAHVTIADVTILASAQTSATNIHRK